MPLTPPLDRLSGYELNMLIRDITTQSQDYPDRPGLQALRAAARRSLGWDHGKRDAFADPLFASLYEAIRNRSISSANSFTPTIDTVLVNLADLLELVRDAEQGAEIQPGEEVEF